MFTLAGIVTELRVKLINRMVCVDVLKAAWYAKIIRMWKEIDRREIVVVKG